LTQTAANLHREIKTIGDAVGTLLVDAFHYLALFAIGATTVWSAVSAFFDMVAKGRADLSDILLLFIYLELGAMVGIYFKTTELPVRYLIYIAITALGRVLIEIVGAEHRTGTDLLILAGAILALSFAVLVLRFALAAAVIPTRSSQNSALRQGNAAPNGPRATSGEPAMSKRVADVLVETHRGDWHKEQLRHHRRHAQPHRSMSQPMTGPEANRKRPILLFV
jgi:phosphate starvation-inducible membrane PsiE